MINKIVRTEQEILDIDELWQRHWSDKFGLPNRREIIHCSSSYLDKSLICTGIIRFIPEAIILTELDADNVLRDRAIHQVLDRGERFLKKSQIDGYHCWIHENIAFENYLRKRHGFVSTSGTPLYKDLTNG